MPFMRRFAALTGAVEAARRYARNNPEKVRQYSEKAGAFVDKQTKGKYHNKIDNAVRKINKPSGGQA